MAVGKFLVVDHDEIAQFIFKRIMGRMKRTEQVTFVKNGKQALELIEKEKFDLIVTDVNLPVMDGFDLLKALNSRQQGGTFTQPPTVILCSSEETSDKAAASQFPSVKGYLIKPFSENHMRFLLGLSKSGE